VIGVSLLPDEEGEMPHLPLRGGNEGERRRERERGGEEGAILSASAEAKRLSSELHSMSLVLYVVCNNQYAFY
jgi:hypothetical protein